MQPSSGMTLYFAYGSNLDTTQMKMRLGRVPRSTIARLPGYRFAFNTDDIEGMEVYANIVAEEGSNVWGVVYECKPAELDKLDQYEDVDSGHYRRGRVLVVTPAGESLETEAYFACDGRLCAERQPSLRYGFSIVSGAREHGLPPDYIRQIEMLAGRT